MKYKNCFIGSKCRISLSPWFISIVGVPRNYDIITVLSMMKTVTAMARDKTLAPRPA